MHKFSIPSAILSEIFI